MRPFIILAGMLVLLSACAAPTGKEAAAARKQEIDKPFSENLQKDGDELTAEYTEDNKILQKQVEKDSAQMTQNTGKIVNRMANTARDNLKRTGRQLRAWIITPLPEEKAKPIAASYCYNVLQDILCYRQPMPGWEHRLVGYQGTKAAPPPLATMTPLPTIPVDEKLLPKNRVANAQPVFSEIPADTKTKEKDATPQAEPPPAEAAHETLPDPALAPQL